MSTGVRRADFSPEVEPIEFGLSTARPTTPRAGRVRYETDTSQYVYYDGSTWQTFHASAENVQDTVGAMFSGNTEYGVTVSYEDGDGTLDTALDLNGLTTEASPALTDYIPIVDVDDSNASNKTLVTNLLKLIYPVDSIYLSYTSTNPATTFGFGTWTAIAEGEALVGKKSSGTFATVGSIGAAGAETVALTVLEMPAHTHTGPSHAHTGPTGSWLHHVGAGSGTRADAGTAGDDAYDRDTLGSTGSAGTGDTGSAGSNTAHNNIQPSYVVYVWRRTA